MRQRRRWAAPTLSRAVALGVVGGLFTTAGLAWACSAQAHVTLSPREAPAGTRVTVTGQSFIDGQVEIRWNSADGTLLKVIEQRGSFATTIVVPDVSPGVYPVVAVIDQYQAQDAFEVTTEGAAAGPSGTRGATTSGGPVDATDTGGQQGAGAGSTRTSGAGQSGAESAGDGRSSAVVSAGGDQTGSREGATEARTSGASSQARTAAPASQESRRQARDETLVARRHGGAPAASAPARRPLSSPGNGQTFFEGSVAETVGSPSASGELRRRTHDSVSRQASSADLWSGFDLGSGSLSRRSHGLASAVPEKGSGAPVAGVALLALGTLVLLAGVVAARLKPRSAVLASRVPSSD